MAFAQSKPNHIKRREWDICFIFELAWSDFLSSGCWNCHLWGRASCIGIAQARALLEPQRRQHFRYTEKIPRKLARPWRASSSLVGYLHYRLLVRITNKYNGTSAVFAGVLTLVLFQWFSTFWTINHFKSFLNNWRK